MKRLQHLTRCEKGSVATEFAFIGLLLFTVTIGIIEVGRALFMLNELSHAADRAAREVLLNFGVDEAVLETAVDARLTGLVSANVVLVSPKPAASASFRSLTVSYPFAPILSGFTIDAVTLSTSRQIAR